MKKENTGKIVNAAESKAEALKTDQYFFKAIFAGMAITLGMVFSNVVSINCGKFPGAIAFSLGLLLIIFMQGELFTGNNFVMAYGVYNKSITICDMLSVWFVSLFGNFVGCIVTSGIIYKANISGFKEFYEKLMQTKLSTDLYELFFRAVLCNVFVCLAVICGIILENEVSKVLMVILCISAFIMCGFEHSVANISAFTLGALYASEINVTQIPVHMAVVILGNIVGGAIFLGMFVYLMSEKEAITL